MSVRIAALWSMGSQYAAFLIQFIVSVLISRFFLDPAEVGLFSIALAAAMLVSILQDFGITRYVSGQAEMDEETIRACSTISFIFAWGIALVVLAAAWPVAHFYGDPAIGKLMAIIAASYLLVPFATVPVALLVRDMDYRALFFVNAGSPLIGGCFALILAANGYSASSLAWAMVAQTAARALFAHSHRPVRPRWPVSRTEAKPITGFGQSSMLLAISASIGMRTPDLIVGGIISVEAVGLYSRATALAGQLSTLVTGAINGVFYPAFARMRDSGAELGAPYIRVVSGNTAVQWAAMAGLAVASEPLVLMLYGERWAAAAPLLFWTAIAEMCFVAVPMHVDMPILLGRIKTLIRYNLFDTAAAVILLVLAAQWGVEWAAMARLAYGLIWVLIYIRFQQRLVAFVWRDVISVYLLSAICAAAAVVPMLLAYQFWRRPVALGVDGLLICTALGVLCWGAMLYLVRHPARHEITGMLASLAQLAGFLHTSDRKPSQ